MQRTKEKLARGEVVRYAALGRVMHHNVINMIGFSGGSRPPVPSKLGARSGLGRNIQSATFRPVTSAIRSRVISRW